MDLSEIRQAFVKRSGRYDLVVAGASPPESGADNGANFYINSGQRYLDRLDNLPKSYGRVFKHPSAGYYYVLFQDCRAIKEVWAGNSESRGQLEKKNMADMRTGYPKPPGEYTNGAPLYYSPAFLRAVPETDRMPIDNFEGIIDYADVMFDAHYMYNGVIFMPPTDGTYTIEVWGLFYSPTLSADTDKSFWSEAHPSILLMAAMRELEIVYRNTEGVRDWERAIMTEISNLGRDAAEEESAEVSQIKG